VHAAQPGARRNLDELAAGQRDTARSRRTSGRACRARSSASGSGTITAGDRPVATRQRQGVDAPLQRVLPPKLARVESRRGPHRPHQHGESRALPPASGEARGDPRRGTREATPGIGRNRGDAERKPRLQQEQQQLLLLLKLDTEWIEASVLPQKSADMIAPPAPPWLRCRSSEGCREPASSRRLARKPQSSRSCQRISGSGH
jgi:hypothetical protein